MPIITLTTDFGAEDWFTGTMKGVILSGNPRATLVDISHTIPAGDIRAGAFALAAACRFFPRGTVHLAVVDPGVGSNRDMIAVRTRDYFFVGPDNGLLSWALAKESVRCVHRLENPRYFLSPVSRTFQGRDVFAPVAAHLSRGVPIAKLGPCVSDYQAIQFPAVVQRAGQLVGEILRVDHFGNAITNIPGDLLGSGVASAVQIKVATRQRPLPMVEFYGAVPKGTPVAIIGSTGFLEIAINDGNAAARLRLKVGGQVIVQGKRGHRMR